LFYRFIEFTSRLINLDLPHETFKLIALDQYTAQSKTELRVKRFSNAFRYLINNLRSNVTKELMETTYFILVGKKLSKKNSMYLLEQYYQRLDDHAHQKATQLFLSVMGLNVTSKTEFAFMFANYILIKRAFYPIIIYPNDKKIYLDAIKSAKSNPNQFYLLVVQTEHFIRKTHAHEVIPLSKQKSKDEIVTFFKNQKEILMKEYHVRQLYLYGSYVKDTNIATSDVDILVVLDEYIINYEKQEVLRNLRKYLTEVMAYRIDIMEFSHALSSLEIHEMTNIITII
jgi:predicted nucleotidyltransferase